MFQVSNKNNYLSNYKGKGRLDLTGLRLKSSQDDTALLQNKSPMVLPLSE